MHGPVPIRSITRLGPLAITLLFIGIGASGPAISSEKSHFAALQGEWALDSSGDGKAHFGFTVHRGKGHENWGFTIPLRQVEGLDASVLRGGSARVSFRLHRDAGTLECEGRVARGHGDGLFELVLDPTFAEALQKLGVGAPTAEQQTQMAMCDVDLDLVHELRAQGVRSLDAKTLMILGLHGVNRRYAELGYRPGDTGVLLAARDHGVDPEFIRGLADNGYSGLPLEDLIRLRDHGVGPEFIRGMASAGFKGLTPQRLIEARDHGVDPEFIRELRAAGYAHLTLGELLRARDHGVDGEVARRARAKAGRAVPLDQVVAWKDRGEVD